MNTNHVFSSLIGLINEIRKRIIAKYNKLPPNSSTDNPKITLEKYELTKINSHVRVKTLIIKTYKGFLNTPFNPDINFMKCTHL